MALLGALQAAGEEVDPKALGNRDVLAAPEQLHPSLWRASQIARSSARCIDTGFSTLSHQLPGRGWPTATLVDLLLQQHGIGELRLLAPALARVSARKIVMLQPPHPPQSLALRAMGLEPGDQIWLKPTGSADAMWAAEQVLKSGSCGALLVWASHIRSERLRRLHLAAQAGDTLFFMLRPLSAADDSSPAPLRVSLRAAPGGIDIGFLKRRGPQRDEPLFLPLAVPANLSTRRVPEIERGRLPVPQQDSAPSEVAHVG